MVLTVSACTNFPLKKTIHKAEEPQAPKKVEEPAAKKTEPADKPQLPLERRAEQELNWGIRNYEEGDYKSAASNFQNALVSGLQSVGDQITAHKFLGFIYCISGEKMACRGEFKKIMNLNPKFELTHAEAGHPIWGPVFRDVREEATSRKTRKK